MRGPPAARDPSSIAGLCCSAVVKRLDDTGHSVSSAQRMLVGQARLGHGLPKSLVLDEDRHRRAVPVDDRGNLVCGS
jgi:hypothetical protein